MSALLVKYVQALLNLKLARITPARLCYDSFVFFLNLILGSGVWLGHASHVLLDQILRACLTNFCPMKHKFFNLMGSGSWNKIREI